jgi:magnesium transporter
MAEVVGVFETVLQKQAVLAGFIPVILGTGGNVGTQAATVAVRAIATGEIANGHSLSTIFRETRIGLLLGLAFAVTLGGYALLRWMEEPRVGAAIGGAILLTAATAATVGATVPLLLRRIGVDPAVATGPFVTTCIDLLAMTIYFVACAILFGL